MARQCLFGNGNDRIELDLSTECPKTAAEALLEGSAPRPLVAAMTIEEVATAAVAMMTGVIGTARAMMTEETMTAHGTMTGGTTSVLATMTGGTTGPFTMIALVCRPPTPLVSFP